MKKLGETLTAEEVKEAEQRRRQRREERIGPSFPTQRLRNLRQNVGYKPLALEMGMTAEGPYYRDPKRPELLFDSHGRMTRGDEECGKCLDAYVVKLYPPASRASRGAWDYDLVVCSCWSPAE